MPINSQFPRWSEVPAPNPATLSNVISELFPPGVAAAELRVPGDSSLLYPEEAATVMKAVPKRAGEFAAGRLCARRALAEFGVAGFALKAAPDRAPVWPDSMVGSITHTPGFCAAAVAERRRFRSLGLDVETVGDVKRELWPRICVPQELAWLDSLPAADRASAAALIFSAKEAFYKCQHPVTGHSLAFADLCVTVPGGEAGGRGGRVAEILAALTRPLAILVGTNGRFSGTYRFIEGRVAAAFCLPAAGALTSPRGSAPRRRTAARG